MAAQQYDIVIEQNATYALGIYWSVEPVGSAPISMNLEGYSGKMEIKDSVGGTVFYTLLTLPGVPATYTPSLGNGAIAIGATDGYIEIHLPDYITNGFTWVSGVYDLDIIDPLGNTRRLIQGKVTISPAVTTIPTPPPSPFLMSYEYGLQVILSPWLP